MNKNLLKKRFPSPMIKKHEGSRIQACLPVGRGSGDLLNADSGLQISDFSFRIPHAALRNWAAS
jgi:hypothetical protein